MNPGGRLFGIGGMLAATGLAACGTVRATATNDAGGPGGSSTADAIGGGESSEGSAGDDGSAGGSGSDGSGGAISSDGTSSAGGGPDATVQSCGAGICPCGDGGQVCGTQCVYTMDDPENCGGCGQQCRTGWVCSGGACVCGGDLTVCGFQCVDLQSDGNNCGYCGHGCQGTACQDGLCSVSLIAEAQAGYLVGDIAVSSTDIYWTSPNTTQAFGGVMGQALGGASTIVFAPIGTENSPAGIAVDDDNLYWVDSAAPGSVVEYNFLLGQRYTWPADDAGASQIESPLNLAIDSNNIYWVDNQAGTVNQTAITPGGPITVLAQSRVYPRAIATDGTNVYWVDFGTESGASANGTVNQVPVGGGDVVSLATGEDEPTDIATDGAYVYWVDDANPGSVKRVAVGGGVPPTVLASGQLAPYGIALDPPPVQYVYWTNYDGGTVMKVPIAGNAAPYTIAVQQDTPAAICVDEAHVYWAADFGIYSVAK